MSSDLLPIVVARSLARKTFKAQNAPALIVAVMFGSSFLQTGRPELLGALGMLMLLSAFPNAAVELVAMDRDGRLDHVRLAAWAPMRVLLMTFTVSAAPWIVGGAVLLGVSLSNAGVKPGQRLAVVILFLGSLVLSLAVIAVRATRRIDPRMAAAGVFAAAFTATGFYVTAAIGVPAPIRRLVREYAGDRVMEIGVLIVMIEVLAGVIAAPRVVRLLRRPVAASDDARAAGVVPAWLRRTCPPLIVRGLTLGSRAAMLPLAISLAITSLVFKQFIEKGVAGVERCFGKAFVKYGRCEPRHLAILQLKRHAVALEDTVHVARESLSTGVPIV